MIRHIIPMVRQRNHIVTLKEEEFPEEDKVVVENIFLEEDEEAEEER
jgi:hypothetical protein